MHVYVQLFGRWHDCDAFYSPFLAVSGFEVVPLFSISDELHFEHKTAFLDV